MKRNYIIAIAVVSLLVGGLIIYLQVSDLESAMSNAEEFFIAARDGNYSDAEDYLSEEFRGEMPLIQTIKFLNTTGLIKFIDAEWNAVVNNDKITIEGHINTADRSRIELSIVMVREEDDWKIRSIFPVREEFTRTHSKEIPGRRALFLLLSSTMQEIGEAVNSGEYKRLHQMISKEMKRYYTPETLEDYFENVEDNDIDLTDLKNRTPHISIYPDQNSEGRFFTRGYYEYGDKKIIFDMSFVYENKYWKLSRIIINVE